MKIITFTGSESTYSNDRSYTGEVLTPLDLKTTYRSKFGSLLVLLIFGLIAFLIPSTSYSQSVTLPPQSDCVSNDLLVVEAQLEAPVCVDCQEGDVESFPLVLSIDNKTGSFRPTFAFFGTLEVRDAFGNLISTTSISGCNDTEGLPSKTITEVTFQNIDYTCGTNLKLTNLYLAWTDASKVDNQESKNSCTNVTTVVNSSGFLDISPKCGTLGELDIQTPLSGNVKITDVSCYEFNDGELEALPVGGKSPYAYLWSTNETTKKITGLTAGTYTVTITDANGCTDTLENIEITEPVELEASLVSSTNVSCNGDFDGAIDISVTGGTPGYTYLWSNNATTEDLSGLAAGTYSVTVTDANGCTDTLENIEVETPSTLEVVLKSTINITCFGGTDGAIDVMVSGGTMPYSFDWSNGAMTEDISGLSAGTYSVTVTDANNCSFSLNDILITEPVELEASLVSTENVSCNGDSNGAIDISVAGGTPGYTYLWSNNATTEDISGLVAGTYSVTVTDANGCTDTLENIEITEPKELEITLESVTNAKCSGHFDGSIDISVTGGTPGYTYLWSNNATTEDLSGLSAGTYSVTVTDANNCSFSLNDILIIEPVELEASLVSSTNVNCNGDSDGTIDISVTGGTPGYTYLWSNNATMEDISGLAAGTYSVTVTDANGCTDTLKNIEITEPVELEASLVSAGNVSCNGDFDGSIDISVTGGTPGYTYLWSNNATTEDLSGLAAGTYSVTVTDANGCTDTLENIEIIEPEILNAEIVTADVSCSNNGGSISVVNATGGSGNFEFSIDSGANWQPGGEFTMLDAGIYNVQIRDKNATDCVVVLNNHIEIVDPGFPNVDLDVENATCFGNSDGSITVTITGGVAPYTVNGNIIEGNVSVISALSAGFYGVTVVDANECGLAIDDIEIEELPLFPIPETDKKQTDCLGGNGGISFINLDPAVDLYYSIDGEDFVEYTGEISLPVGTYSFRVSDGIDSCPSDEFDVLIGRPQAVDLILMLEAVQPTCEILSGTLVIGNDKDGLLFSLNGSDFEVFDAANYTGLAPGAYQVQARSANGCIFGTANITLFEATNCDAFEGCTLGYWKNHTDRWCNTYQTCTAYGEVFTNAPAALADLTLLEVLNLGGGGINNLGRQSVAALLNTCSDGVDFYYVDEAELIAYVNANFGRNKASAAGTYLDGLNNAGCTLGGTSATSAPSENCDTDEADNGNNGNNGKPGKKDKSSISKADISAYPVPFKETLNIKYEFDYQSPATIQFFDMRGQLLRTVKEAKAFNGKITTINIDFSMRANQMYVVKVTTDRETFVKQIISGR